MLLYMWGTKPSFTLPKVLKFPFGKYHVNVGILCGLGDVRGKVKPV